MLLAQSSVMGFFAHLLLVVSCVAPFVRAQTARFENPPEASDPPADPNTIPALKIGDFIEVVWTASADAVDLVIGQIGTPSEQIDR
jgi:hypothetical protein